MRPILSILFLFVSFALYSQNEEYKIEFPDTLWMNGEYNDDGQWQVHTNRAYLEYKAQIFDRWGKVVHVQNTTIDPWVPNNYQSGTFYYTIRIKWNLTKEENFEGKIIVIR